MAPNQELAPVVHFKEPALRARSFATDTSLGRGTSDVSSLGGLEVNTTLWDNWEVVERQRKRLISSWKTIL